MVRSPREPSPLGASDPILDYSLWSRKVEELARTCVEAQPFPHVVLHDLLLPGVTKQLEMDVPRADEGGWTHYKHFNERKQGRSRRDQLPASLLRAIDELNSERFRGLLSRLTGVPNLLPDTDFSAGGGLSICGRGGFLNIHTDFTVHPYHPSWRRRVNLIFYLNHGWDEAWGGHTELWDHDVKACQVRVAPHANTALVFRTDVPSYHGHPEPMQCPEGVVRKTLALYYFTEEPEPVSIATDYVPRPSDSWFAKLAIRVDRGLLRVYHAVKRRLGIRDTFASRILSFLEKFSRR